MPAAATAGASSVTSGLPVPMVATVPAVRTATLAISQGSSSDGVVTRARARPGERSSRRAVRSTRPGERTHITALPGLAGVLGTVAVPAVAVAAAMPGAA